MKVKLNQTFDKIKINFYYQELKKVVEKIKFRFLKNDNAHARAHPHVHAP